MSFTSDLATAVVDAGRRELPAEVSAMAIRALINVAATAVAASRHPAVESTIRQSRPGSASVPGRRDMVTRYHAALATGVAANIEDFDDTYLRTVVHPGATAFAAAYVLGTELHCRGDAFLRAFALAVEMQIRLSEVLATADGDSPWHNTGTTGVIGSAIAAGLLHKHSSQTLATAIDLAAVQGLGHRAAVGTLTKPLHHGKAAANGLLCAELADRGTVVDQELLDGPGGYFAAITPSPRPNELLDGFGEIWRIAALAFKPYPTGIVTHPVIEACIRLHPQVPRWASVSRIAVRCHPLVVVLTGIRLPSDELQARLSTAHLAATALLEGRMGLPELGTEFLRRGDIGSVRDLVVFDVVEDFGLDEAVVTLELMDGNRLEVHVEHAIGSLAFPMSGADVERKAIGLIEPALPGRSGAVIAAVAGLPTASSIDALVDSLTPAA